MKSWSIALLLLSIFAAGAQESSITFNAERYVKASEETKPGERFASFVLPGNAEKRISFYYYPNSGDPLQLAAETAKRLQANDPLFRFALLKNNTANEAMLDYLLSSEKDDKIEFHVLKYATAPGGKGVAAADYRQSFAHGELDADDVQKLRTEMIAGMAKFDLRQMNGYFGLP